MVLLATMNLTLRGLANVRVRLRNVLTTNLDNERKEQLGLPQEGFHVIAANPPFAVSGKVAASQRPAFKKMLGQIRKGLAIAASRLSCISSALQS